MGIFQKLVFLCHFSAKLLIFLCFNAKESCTKHPKGEGDFQAFLGGEVCLITLGVGGRTSLIMGGNIVSLFLGAGDIVTSIKS